jgi:hypothetical protein
MCPSGFVIELLSFSNFVIENSTKMKKSVFYRNWISPTHIYFVKLHYNITMRSCTFSIICHTWSEMPRHLLSRADITLLDHWLLADSEMYSRPSLNFACSDKPHLPTPRLESPKLHSEVAQAKLGSKTGSSLMDCSRTAQLKLRYTYK